MARVRPGLSLDETLSKTSSRFQKLDFSVLSPKPRPVQPDLSLSAIFTVDFRGTEI